MFCKSNAVWHHLSLGDVWCGCGSALIRKSENMLDEDENLTLLLYKVCNFSCHFFFHPLLVYICLTQKQIWIPIKFSLSYVTLKPCHFSFNESFDSYSSPPGNILKFSKLQHGMQISIIIIVRVIQRAISSKYVTTSSKYILTTLLVSTQISLDTLQWFSCFVRLRLCVCLAEFIFTNEAC